jgi:hypothetical protein
MLPDRYPSVADDRAGHLSSGNEAASSIIRRVLLQAEEDFVADPWFTLGTWLARVQETISVASAVALSGIDARRHLEDDDVAAEAMGVFADLCAEAIRAAARLSPESMSADPKEMLLASVGEEEVLGPAAVHWSDLKDALVRCQAAIEPIANGLREGDLPMSRDADPDGVVYANLIEVIRQGYGVVFALCAQPSITPALTSGVAGASVRATSRRIYAKASLKALEAGLVLVVAFTVALKGATAVAGVLIVFAVFLARKARGLQGSADDYRRGAIGEEGVGERLLELSSPWRVEHDVAKTAHGCGNIDHLVHSPTAIFSIDTKLSRVRSKDFDQARRHAAWVGRRYGTSRSIISVICVQTSGRPPEMVDGAWVVGAGQLVGFLLAWDGQRPTALPLP